jgi:hypothetical protein
MSLVTERRVADCLDPEKVAYWYFRLNGFLQIENFVVHEVAGGQRGNQRTDADLLGVRFRHRREFLIDRPQDPMEDDPRLLLSPDLDDVVIVEVKANQQCALNGPWTNPTDRNMHRVLAAIGLAPQDAIDEVAERIYRDGCLIFRGTRIRLVAIGDRQNSELGETYYGVVQLSWDDVLGFIYERFQRYRNQKRNVHQWDDSGRLLKRFAEETRPRDNPSAFVNHARKAMQRWLDRPNTAPASHRLPETG